jgi:hypothetical protein
MLPSAPLSVPDTERRQRRRRTALRHGLVLIGFVLVAVLLTWPLAANLRTALPGTALDDNAVFFWNFWWVRHALADPSASVFATNALFYPDGMNLVLHSYSLLNAAAGATILRWLPLAAALNLTLLVACALNGFTLYLLAFRQTKAWFPSFIAGVFFAACPIFTVHLFGHFSYYTAWPLVLFVGVWLHALERVSWRAAALAGFSLAVVAYADYYYFVYALVFALIATGGTLLEADLVPRPSTRTRLDTILLTLAVIAIGLNVLVAASGGAVWQVGPLRVSLKTGTNVRAVATALLLWWLWRRRRWRMTSSQPSPRLRWAKLRQIDWRRPAAMCGAAGIVAAALMAPILYHAFGLWRAGQYVTQAYLWRSAPPGVDLAGIVSGNPFNPLWGAWVRRIYDVRAMDGFNDPLWLGVVPLVLLLTRQRWMTSRTARRWLLVTMLFLIWALGPFLTVFGLNTGLPLPQILLRYVPIVSNARIPAHASVMVCLGVALLLAIALTRVRADAGAEAAVPGRRSATCPPEPSGRSWKREGGRRPWIDVGSDFGRSVLLALILIDFIAVPFPMTTLERPALYERLAALPAGAVLDVPTGIRDGFGPEGVFDASILYFQSIHEHPIATGYVGRMPPAVRARFHDSPVMRTLFQLSRGEETAPSLSPEAARQELADSWRVRYLVVQRSAHNAVRTFVSAMGLPMIDGDDMRAVYAVE